MAQTLITRILAERWNGRGWRIQPTPNPPGGEWFLTAVSCTSPSACTAVGNQTLAKTLAERWNRRTWQVQATPNPAGAQNITLGGVTCPASTVCTAFRLNKIGSAPVTLAERWSGGRDVYLVVPPLRGLSVKLRRGRALEVKVYQGSPGILEVAGRARGRLESWDKWSFPGGPPGAGGAEVPGWCPVRKLIRRFSPVSGRGGARVRGLGEEPGCAVELTEVRAGGQAWWTLGFEATRRTIRDGQIRERKHPRPLAG